MSAILDSYELLVTTQGMDLEPIGTPDPTNPKVIIPLDVALIKVWKMRNADALCAIVTSVSDSVLMLIQYTSKAVDAWNGLKNQYETRNQTRIQNLESQLAAEKLYNGELAEVFITRIKNLCDQMVAVGIAKTNEELGRRCIRVSPSKYDSLIKGKDNNVEKKKGKNKKKFSCTCNYCNKKGHTTKDYRKRIHDEKNGTLKPTWNVRQWSFATHDQQKDWHGSLKPLHEPINVIVGNNAKCLVEGIGSIFLKITNGQGKNLSNFLYVPQIKRNLLSVVAITDRDYEVRFMKTKVEIINSNDSIVGEGI
ncbi:uncharacterized protein LOC131158743 [Malania oleifera]|uniref:uncharacterized protein LOC131158743 n=1 Tax=Malania oleifera TaxID=397392 RepID=UPI0025AE67A1|nr:uncharacterized protein LOC131158743 [Malania oleifera]